MLLSVGRLVERKGFSWFIQEVMPRLTPEFLYVIIGDGPERKRIQQILETTEQVHRVLLLGQITDEERNLSYQASDIFIMPNIRIEGDVEGFGIVILEAGSAGLPVIASDIQGISDAVIHGATGCLVAEKDVDGFVRAINDRSTWLEKRSDVP